MPAYCSVPLTYAKLMPNVCNVHQRMDKISHTSAYISAIRCGVSTPLDEEKEVRAVFLGLSKAFDRVWHKGLISWYKCISFGMAIKLSFK